MTTAVKKSAASKPASEASDSTTDVDVPYAGLDAPTNHITGKRHHTHRSNPTDIAAHAQGGSGVIDDLDASDSRSRAARGKLDPHIKDPQIKNAPKKKARR